jgi:hypothetical protein
MRLENYAVATFEAWEPEAAPPHDAPPAESPPVLPDITTEPPSTRLSDMARWLPPDLPPVPTDGAAVPPAPEPPPPAADLSAADRSDAAALMQHQDQYVARMAQVEAQWRQDAQAQRTAALMNGARPSDGTNEYARDMEIASTVVSPDLPAPADVPETADAGSGEPEAQRVPPQGPAAADAGATEAVSSVSDRSLLNAVERAADPATFARVESRTAEAGDSWASLARQTYGDERYAQALAQANGATSTLLLRGQQVVLPDLSGADLRAGGAFLAADAAARTPPQHTVTEGSSIEARSASFADLSQTRPNGMPVQLGAGGRLEPNLEWVGPEGQAQSVLPLDPSQASRGLSSLGVVVRDLERASADWAGAAQGAGGRIANGLTQLGALQVLSGPAAASLDPGLRAELDRLAVSGGGYTPTTEAEKGGYGAVVSVPMLGLEIWGTLQGVGSVGSLGRGAAVEGVPVTSGGTANAAAGAALREDLARQAGIPRRLDEVWGADLADLKATYQLDGWAVADKAPRAGSSGNAQVFVVDAPTDGRIVVKQVQYSPASEASVHGGQYYKFTYSDGSTVKVIDPNTYRVTGWPETNTTFYNQSGQGIVYNPATKAWEPR